MADQTFGKRATPPRTQGGELDDQAGACRQVDFSMAYQPIVDIPSDTIFAHEALVRGTGGEDARTVLGRIPTDETIAFDAACRRKAIQIACSLGLASRLSLNITPEAICDDRYGPHSTIQAARDYGFREDRLILEMTERSVIADMRETRRCLAEARGRGVLVALDDFGAGYSGLNTLVGLKPDIVKVDIGLVDGIESCDVRQAVISALVESCDRLGILIIAEGVETVVQYRTLRALGIELMQGYLFAKPAIGALPPLAGTILPFMQRASGE